MVGLRYSRRTSSVRFAHPHFEVRQFHNVDATESDQRSNWSRTTALSPIQFLHPKSLVSNFRFCAGFRMPACRDHPHARTAGVRKAPRHEIAGCGAPTVQRVLWGFGFGVSVAEVEPMVAIGSL